MTFAEQRVQSWVKRNLISLDKIKYSYKNLMSGYIEKETINKDKLL